jgi:hypothetical protein
MDKYYVGAKHIGSNIARHGHSNGYTVGTVEEAIEQAKETIRNGGADCLVVVKIVAIVRREVPITVERILGE